MRFPRFHIRTLMMAVFYAAIGFGIAGTLIDFRNSPAWRLPRMTTRRWLVVVAIAGVMFATAAWWRRRAAEQRYLEHQARVLELHLRMQRAFPLPEATPEDVARFDSLFSTPPDPPEPE